MMAFAKCMLGSLHSRKTQLALAVRLAVAAVAAYAIARALHLMLPLWAVLTSLIVTQMSVGRSLKATRDYMLGTIGGAIYGGAIAVLIPHTSEGSLLALLVLAVTLLIGAPPDSGCQCATCPYMRLNTLEKLYLALRDLSGRVEVPEPIRAKALAPIRRMLEVQKAIHDFYFSQANRLHVPIRRQALDVDLKVAQSGIEVERCIRKRATE